MFFDVLKEYVLKEIVKINNKLCINIYIYRILLINLNL